MYQVAAPIWNRIAESERITNPLWLQLMKMNEAQLTTALEQLSKQLEAWETDSAVVLSFLTVAPLLAENIAISRWVEKQGDPNLRAALPEVVSVTEAIRLATIEYNLRREQATRLMQLLKEPPALSVKQVAKTKEQIEAANAKVATALDQIASILSAKKKTTL